MVGDEAEDLKFSEINASGAARPARLRVLPARRHDLTRRPEHSSRVVLTSRRVPCGNQGGSGQIGEGSSLSPVSAFIMGTPGPCFLPLQSKAWLGRGSMCLKVCGSIGTKRPDRPKEKARPTPCGSSSFTCFTFGPIKVQRSPVFTAFIGIWGKEVISQY